MEDLGLCKGINGKLILMSLLSLVIFSMDLIIVETLQEYIVKEISMKNDRVSNN